MAFLSRKRSCLPIDDVFGGRANFIASNGSDIRWKEAGFEWNAISLKRKAVLGDFRDFLQDLLLDARRRFTTCIERAPSNETLVTDDSCHQPSVEKRSHSVPFQRSSSIPSVEFSPLQDKRPSSQHLVKGRPLTLKCTTPKQLSSPSPQPLVEKRVPSLESTIPKQLSPQPFVEKKFPSLESAPSVIPSETLVKDYPCHQPSVEKRSTSFRRSGGKRLRSVSMEKIPLFFPSSKKKVVLSTPPLSPMPKGIKPVPVKSFIPAKNIPKKLAVTKEVQKARLLEKVLKKEEEEAKRKEEIKEKRQREIQLKKKQREEKARRVAEKQAALKMEKENKTKNIVEHHSVRVEQLKQKKAKLAENNLKYKERMVAAELRRKHDEEMQKKRLQQLEEGKEMAAKIAVQRREAEEEEKRQKRLEKQCQERERHDQKKVPVDRERNNHAPPLHPNGGLLQKRLEILLAGSKKPPPSPPINVSPLHPSPSNKKFLEQFYTESVSYQMTPADPLILCDNYDIKNLSSEDSTDDEDCPKKEVPLWVQPKYLDDIVASQEKALAQNEVDLYKIFPPEELLEECDLAKMFKFKRKRFFQRSSSALWTSPLIKRNK